MTWRDDPAYQRAISAHAQPSETRVTLANVDIAFGALCVLCLKLYAALVIAGALVALVLGALYAIGRML